ncbi:MAG: hypothetical protein WC047_08340 [Kiritimatiellales bacterium]
MKGKALVIILATVISAWALWSGALGACFEKNGASGYQIILKTGNCPKGSATINKYLCVTFAKIAQISDTAFSSIGGPELVQKCREQPVLFGTLFIFFGVSACGIAFIVHLIRTDARF